MSDCLFCKIRDGEIPAKRVLDTEDVLAFEDINPAAPTHVLVIPKQHIQDIDALDEATAPVVGQLFLAAQRVARERGLSKGYRVVMNNGREAGQSVFHVHLHVLGGRPLSWPPG